MHQKGFIPIIFLIIFAIGIAGAYYLGTKNSFENLISYTSPTPIATPTLQVEYKEVPFWDITIQYPSDWSLPEEGMPRVSPPFLEDGKDFPSILFDSIKNPSNLTVKDYDEKASQEGIDPGFYSAGAGEGEVIAEEKNISGIKAYLMRDQNCEPLSCDKFSFSYKGRIYILMNIVMLQLHSQVIQPQNVYFFLVKKLKILKR